MGQLFACLRASYERTIPALEFCTDSDFHASLTGRIGPHDQRSHVEKICYVSVRAGRSGRHRECLGEGKTQLTIESWRNDDLKIWRERSSPPSLRNIQRSRWFFHQPPNRVQRGVGRETQGGHRG